MVLTKDEMKEWKSIYTKSKKYKIPIKRITGTSNVVFGDKIYAQLGTGTATRIMDAKIKLKKRFKK